MLVKTGWKPQLNQDGEFADIKYLWYGQDYREVGSCAFLPSGLQQCSFYFRRNNFCLRVIASGEDADKFVTNSSDNQCPITGGEDDPANPPIKGISVHMPFLAARKVILKDGWLPVVTQQESILTGLERTLARKHRVREIDHCTMDLPLCMFKYQKGGNTLTVFSWGEQMNYLELKFWYINRQ